MLPRGIEPRSTDPQSVILSVERRELCRDRVVKTVYLGSA